MKKFYLSSKTGTSGICKYSRDFYELVLKDKDYIFVDSNDRVSSILSLITSRDHVHIEIGIFQKKEIELLFLMLKANYKNVSVTLHDAPLIKYPYYEFNNYFLNGLSKLYERYAGGFGAATAQVRKIAAIYVLTHKGVEAVRKKYNVDSVHYLPHIIDTAEVVYNSSTNKNFIYFGFIGQNKGIDYSLQLHEQLLPDYPDLQFNVVGQPLGREIHYYNSLKDRYKTNVHYHGYLGEKELDAVFQKSEFAVFPFKDYRFYWPVSGSILYSLKKGKIVLTNKVNSIAEMIQEGSNGFYLSGNLKKDSRLLASIIADDTLRSKVKTSVFEYIASTHSPEAVRSKLMDKALISPYTHLHNQT